MTVVTAERITTAGQAVRIAAELAESFAAGAAERDLSRRLPHEELDQLAASGLLAITGTSPGTGQPGSHQTPARIQKPPRA